MRKNKQEKDQFEDEEFISIAEAGRILCLKPKTVYNRRGGTEGLLRIKQGRTVRLIRSEVIAHKANAIQQAQNAADMVRGHYDGR